MNINDFNEEMHECVLQFLINMLVISVVAIAISALIDKKVSAEDNRMRTMKMEVTR